ncbi:Wadjet anti-phage system protein JetA family protein [Agaribacterium haliotis]|uniref:Wadjet anti-phage system protein JetA family protein n=1 Tax=Agaribacterium haliotis TaxID=2013869 RepID=UPI000BB563B7|nr:Wadjet anti-phage system protein JetA family protein [Agaribacterium haliotis]
MFFSSERQNFFKPLTSKYREQIVQCLSLLYQRLYSASADYGQSLKREQLVELFEEALARSQAPVFEDSDESSEQRFRNHREQASWVLKALLDAGWIERQVDNATFQSRYPFSRMGRLFTQALNDADSKQIRTRHRNTRNTLNALEAFASRGEIYDLLDALDYSERIVTDFSDIISELEDLKRELVREVEAQQLVHEASDQFFDYMEKRFQPDIAVRLSADSVEKHRDDINKVITSIRRKKKEFKQQAEQALRQSAPQLCHDQQSYLWWVLDTIELRMRNAADIMLPALRRALHGFTKRADIVIRQLSFLSSQADEALVDICRELADLDQDSYSKRLDRAAEKMATTRLRLLDPRSIKVNERRKKAVVDTRVEDEREVDLGARQQLMVQQLLDQAFVFNRENLQNYMLQAMRNGQSVNTRDLPVENARDLLAIAHVIELGAVNNLDSGLKFEIQHEGLRDNFSKYYQQSDVFSISLVDTDSET